MVLHGKTCSVIEEERGVSHQASIMTGTLPIEKVCLKNVEDKWIMRGSREAKIINMRKQQLNIQRKVDTRRKEIGRPHRRNEATVKNGNTQYGQLNTVALAVTRCPERDSDENN